MASWYLLSQVAYVRKLWAVKPKTDFSFPSQIVQVTDGFKVGLGQRLRKYVDSQKVRWRVVRRVAAHSQGMNSPEKQAEAREKKNRPGSFSIGSQ